MQFNKKSIMGTCKTMRAIAENAVAGVITAIALAGIAVFWNWYSNGGLLERLEV
jgi:hypothetical protein